MYNIRFNKGRGKYYKHWRVENLINKNVEYYDPKFFSISMQDCILINKETIAKEVFDTQRRNVCGFVRCKEYKILKRCYHKISDLQELLYDPKIAPFWRKDNYSESFDNTRYEKLATKGKKIFVIANS
jgi:hypothetical protein